MSPYQLIAVYSLMIVATSLLGGALPHFFKLSHTQMQVILSFVGGLMLGIGLLHMLPHGIVISGSLDLTIVSTMAGLLFMFFLIRTFHFHQHGASSGAEEAHEDCDHDQSHDHHHDHGPIHELSWAGVATGLAIHTLIDGIALGGAVMSDFASNPIPAAWGLGVFLAIALHKPLDALSITTLMTAGGWSSRAQWTVNFCFAVMCPIGALLFVFGISSLAIVGQSRVLGMALGFSAGTFLCISLSDLLPEVQFHRHDRLKLSAALVFGVVAAYGIGLLEHPHSHRLPAAMTAQPVVPSR